MLFIVSGNCGVVFTWTISPCEEPLEVKIRRIFCPQLISQSLGFWIAKNTTLCPLYEIDAKPLTFCPFDDIYAIHFFFVIYGEYIIPRKQYICC